LQVRPAAPQAELERSQALAGLGLMPALRECVARFERRTGIAAEVIGADVVSEVDPAAETALVRIVQEALDNVAAHAQVRTVRILLKRCRGQDACHHPRRRHRFAAADGEKRAAKGGLVRM